MKGPSRHFQSTRPFSHSLLAVLLLIWAAAGPASELRLISANIVDPETQVIRQGELWIRDGNIVPAGDPSAYEGETLDLGGKWVIPGLNDLHTHAYGNMAPGHTFDSPGTEVVARRLLYAGVTGFLDLFGSEDDLYALRERQQNGEFIGATLFASLSCLTATEGHCTEYGVPTRVMDTPDQARKVVTDLAARRPDVVKIVYAPSGAMPSIDKETMMAAVATAREQGIRTVIHVQSWDDVRDAVEAGASAVTHVPPDPIPGDIPALMVNAGVVSIPTLSVFTELVLFLYEPSVLDNSLAHLLTTPDIIAAYQSEEFQQRFAANRRGLKERTVVRLESVKAMADAGVTILSGSDAGNWGTIQGFSAHRELVKLVDAGFTPWQALAASTTLAGDFLEQSYGVQPGDEASLVVLDASPVDDIRNTQRISTVIYRGKIIDRDALLRE
jgi:imidazolonepropionase-like amidohydrolase